MLRPALACCLLGLGACATDSATEPAVAIDTPGAFIAVDTAPGEAPLHLHRMLVAFYLDTGTILFVSTYGVDPWSFEEARAFAEQPALPVRFEIEFLAQTIVEGFSHEVVWFRTLTPEEEARIP